MIKPTRKAPNLVLPTVYHGEFNLFNEDPKNFTMVIFIRGLHCPLCINYLKELTTFLPTLNDLGVDYIISSADDKTRATQMLQKVGSTELRFAYNHDIEKAKEWDLYISKGWGKTSIGVEELDYFPEPGLFLVKPDKTIFSAYIQSMPFARPQIKDVVNSLGRASVTTHGKLQAKSLSLDSLVVGGLQVEGGVTKAALDDLQSQINIIIQNFLS